MRNTFLKESCGVLFIFLKIFLLLLYVAMVLTVAVYLCDNFPLSSTDLDLQPNGLSPLARVCISLGLWVFACAYFPIFIWAILKRVGGEAMYLFRELVKPTTFTYTPEQEKILKMASTSANLTGTSNNALVMLTKNPDEAPVPIGEPNKTGGDLF